jgi:hypothetical protein
MHTDGLDTSSNNLMKLTSPFSSNGGGIEGMIALFPFFFFYSIRFIKLEKMGEFVHKQDTQWTQCSPELSVTDLG